MKYLVICGVDIDGDGKTDLRWKEQEIEAREKWDALVKASENLGIDKKFTMSHLWMHSSIKQKDRKMISRRRVE